MHTDHLGISGPLHNDLPRMQRLRARLPQTANPCRLAGQRPAPCQTADPESPSPVQISSNPHSPGGNHRSGKQCADPTENSLIHTETALAIWSGLLFFPSRHSFSTRGNRIVESFPVLGSFWGQNSPNLRFCPKAKEKNGKTLRFTVLFVVAGTGLEPATSGL